MRKAPQDGLIAVASRSHRDKKTDEYLAHYPVKDFITAGSSLKFCLVAAGEADIYPRHGRTMEWDTAAGHAVLLAAGGSVTQLDGSAVRLRQDAQTSSPIRSSWPAAANGPMICVRLE